MTIKAVTDADFASEVLESDLPVLVDFWADWCQPCKMLAPVLDEVATELSGRVKVVKMDVEGQETPIIYKVRGVPALYMFVNGELKAQTHTFVKQDLLSFVKDSIAEE